MTAPIDPANSTGQAAPSDPTDPTGAGGPVDPDVSGGSTEPADAAGPVDPDAVDRSNGRPGQPVAAAVVVLGAVLAGAGTVAVSSVLESGGLRLLTAVVLVLGGWLIVRPAGDVERPVTRALGQRVLRGVGTSLVVLGAYLGGLALLTMSASATDVEPSAVEVVLIVYGLPTLALLAVATTGMRAWTAAAGAMLPMLTVLLMAAAGATSAAVSITMLVVAVVLAVLVVWAGRGDLAAAAAAMAASFAFGAGTSPFGSLGLTQLGGAVRNGAPNGTLTGPALAVVLAGALLVAAVLVASAVVRRDLACGVLAGSVFAMPPVLLSTWLPAGDRWPGEALAAVAGVPALVALVAAIAVRVRAVRRVLAGPGREAGGGAIAVAACAAAAVAAAVAFATLAMPVLGWPPRAQGAAALLILAVAAALAYWLPGTPRSGDTPRAAGLPGAVAAVAALLGTRLASPWVDLLSGGAVAATPAERVLAGILDLALVVVLAWLLVRRHRRPAVYAAAAYALAGGLAAFLGGLLFDSGYLTGAAPRPFDGELAPVVIIVLPLLLLGVAATVAAYRGRLAVGQAVGAVVLAAGGFVPLKIVVGEFGGVGGSAGYVARLALTPLTPTDWSQASYALRDITGPAMVAVLAMVLVALVLAASLALRQSAPLAGAIALVLLAALQSALLTALSAGSVADAQLLGRLLGVLAGVAVVVALAVGVSAARRTGPYT